ncbi:MAG: DUF2974 domain-containing protein, partial [Clostridia bacterium]|nr:DUF2974 domain-containing protein [Clostridia bacterium]
MALTVEQILMLDNLVYYAKKEENKKYNDVFVGEGDNETIYDLKKSIKRILNCAIYGERGYDKFGYGEDEFGKYYKDYDMTDEEIIMVNKIYNYGNFEGCKIIDATDRNETGFRALTIEDSEGNYYIIFRGTWDKYQWMDDAQGGYMAETASQSEALEYVNDMVKKHNCSNIIVSGHSKGGNLAQYVALRSDNVSKALSYDGQGFSPEFIEKYESVIEENRHKLYQISSFGDVVNQLFIPLTPETHRTFVYSNNNVPVFGPVSYHFPDCIFDEKGNLYESCKPEFTGLFMKKFSQYIVENSSSGDKKIMFDFLMSIAAFVTDIFVEKDTEQDDRGTTFDKSQGICTSDETYMFPSTILDAIVGFIDYSKSNLGLFYLAYVDMYTTIQKYKDGFSKIENAGEIYEFMKFSPIQSIRFSATIISLFDAAIEQKCREIGMDIENFLFIANIQYLNYSDVLCEERDSFYSSTIDFYSDSISEKDKIMTHYGTSSDDNLNGYNFSDDVIYGGDGNDKISGENGDDIIYGNDGEDIILGDDGNDTIYGGAEGDYISGGNGNDTILGGDGNDVISGGEDDDILYGSNGEDHICGGNGNDRLIARNGDSFSMYGEEGNDVYEITADGSKYEIYDYEHSENGLFQGKICIYGASIEGSRKVFYGDDLHIYAKGSKIIVYNYGQEREQDDIVIVEKDSQRQIPISEIKTVDLSIPDGIVLAVKPDSAAYESARKAVKYDPLILDLNNDGKYTKSIEDGTHFDFSDDGFAEKTGWISEEDGFLVRDINGDGIINNGSEFFGDKTILSNGEISTNGFMALADIDSNSDNVINADDETFGELKVWIDSNGNGLSEDGELHTLDELGISQINIKNNITNYNDDNGNTVAREGTFVKEDGNVGSIGEIHFDMDTMDTISKENVDVPDNIKDRMPNLIASGNMYTLHEAMTLDEELYKLVREFEFCRNPDERDTIIEDIVFTWTGSKDIDSSSRGENIDAKHLAVIEKFYGSSFVGTNGANPNNTAGNILNKIYADLMDKISLSLMAQTHIKSLLCLTTIETDAETGENRINYDIVKSILTDVAKENVTNAQNMLYYYIKCLNKNVSLTDIFDFNELKACFEDAGVISVGIGIFEAKNRIYGNEDNNAIYGTSDTEVFYGKDGNDSIYGYDGNDIIYGGKGNDYMNGGAGDDTYVYNLGDGK